jgi:MFS-type transporter involved in bile tolerance (Atg22 family)
MARGAVVMSNIFLASSFIFLASEQAGCLNEEGDEVLDDCNERVYGFKPSSFVSNVAVISGVLSALFMPLFGAMIDYTAHRKTVGAASAFCIILIQATQIGTVSSTWLAMALLQALSGFLYQIEVLATYAFLPDISRVVGEEKMTKRTCIIIRFGRILCWIESAVSPCCA